MIKKQSQQQVLASAKWYQEFTGFVQLKGLRERSQETYLGWISQLAAHYPGRQLPRLNKSQVLDFLVHLQAGRKLKASTLTRTPQ